MVLDLRKECFVEEGEGCEVVRGAVNGAEFLKEALELFAVVVAEGVAKHHNALGVRDADRDVKLAVVRAVHERVVHLLKRPRGTQVHTKRQLTLFAEHNGGSVGGGDGGGDKERHVEGGRALNALSGLNGSG